MSVFCSKLKDMFGTEKNRRANMTEKPMYVIGKVGRY